MSDPLDRPGPTCHTEPVTTYNFSARRSAHSGFALVLYGEERVWGLSFDEARSALRILLAIRKGAWHGAESYEEAVAEFLDDLAAGPDPQTCSLCDGVGHGYPGAGPCPLEERGWMDAEMDRHYYGGY